MTIKAEISDVKAAALKAYEAAPRAGNCAERQQRYEEVLQRALPLSQYARDIYHDDHEDEMDRTRVTSLSLGGGRTAYFDPDGRRYAETRADIAARTVVVVFRGTRIAVARDVATDVANQVGLPTGYYEWAAGVTARAIADHPGYSVTVTGQSLAGGLAIYATLKNPGVKAVALNPAGLSMTVWARASESDRSRLNRSVVTITTRNKQQIEPISALSFAKRSIIPGPVFVVPSDETNERALHGPDAVIASIVRAIKNAPEDHVCEGALEGLL
jgi:hypothetical protein